MKKNLCTLLILLLLATGASCQTQEAQQLLLDVEKLAQLKGILSDMKTGYEILSKGYNTVRDISKGSFDLHAAFLNSLLDVSPVVRNYRRIADIIQGQVTLVTEYKSALKSFRASGIFSAGELAYLKSVYTNLFKRSLNNLGDLTTLVTPRKLRMSDDERLNAIDAVWEEVSDELVFLRHFNDHTRLLALQRCREKRDVSMMNQLIDGQ